jgi:hypothetical protein
MTRKVGELIWLTDEQCRSESEALAEVAAGLAGKARILYELASGEVPGDGDPASGRNPQNSVGADLSGPPWGSALRHSVAWAGTGIVQASNRGPLLTGIGSSTPRWLNFRFYNRPFDTVPGLIAPYSRATFSFRHALSSAGSNTVTWRAWNPAIQEPVNRRGTSFTVSSTSAGGSSPSSSYWVPLQPGWNTIVMSFIGSTTSPTVRLLGMGMHQIAKRSH